MPFAPFRSPQDYFTLDGIASPEIARVTSAPDITYTWESPKADAVSGAQKKFKGRELSKWTVEVSLFSDADLAAWEDFWALFRYPDDKPKKPLASYSFGHPQVNVHGIVDCTIQRSVMRQDAKNFWVVTIDFEEDRKPVPVAKKVEAAAATPNADAKRPPTIQELEAKRAEDARNAALAARDKALASLRAPRQPTPLRDAAVDKGANVSGTRGL